MSADPRVARLELRQFRYFVAVARERHFGRAAASLGIAQSGLSQQVKAVERAVGAELLVRSRSGIELTDAGAVFLEHAGSVLHAARQAVVAMGAVTNTTAAALTVGTFGAWGASGVDEILQAFRERFPDVHVEVLPGFGPQNIEALRSRALDVGFVRLPLPPGEDPSYLRVGTTEVVVALAEGHRLAELDRVPRAEILREPFIAVPRSVNPTLIDHVRRLVFGDRQPARWVELPNAVETDRLLMVARREGISLTPRPAPADPGVSGVVYRPIEEPAPSVEHGVAWFDAQASPQVRAFVSVARAWVGGEAPNGPGIGAIQPNPAVLIPEASPRTVRAGGGPFELRQLQYFVAVAEERHFGRAAGRLMIAQPGVSQQVKALEGSLGIQLLVRDKRHVELTPAGALFLDHARVILERADRALQSARLSARGRLRLLKVGTFVVGNRPRADDVLRRFRAAHPDVEVELHPAFTPQHVGALHERRLDVAFVVLPFDAVDGVRCEVLGSFDVVVAIPEGHHLASLERIPRAALLRERFVVRPRSANPRLVDHLHRALFGRPDHPDPIEVADGAETSQLVVVAEGNGLAAAFLDSSDRPFPGVVYRPVEHPEPRIEFGVAWVDANASPLVPAFVRIARQVAAGHRPDQTAMAGRPR